MSIKKLIIFVAVAGLALSTTAFAEANDLILSAPSASENTVIADASEITQQPTTMGTVVKKQKKYTHHPKKHVKKSCKGQKHCHCK